MKNYKIAIVAVFMFFIGTSSYGQTIRPMSNDSVSVRSYQEKNQMIVAIMDAIQRRQSATLEGADQDTIIERRIEHKTKKTKQTTTARKKSKPEQQ